MTDNELLFNAYFFICQVTGWIRSPQISCYRLGPDPEIPAADIEPSALGTPSFYMGPFIF
jgi:hypothetical protein